MNTTDLLELILVPGILLLSTSVVFAVLWLRARERALRAELSSRAGQSETQADEIARVQQSVDAIALEVERLGEGQRFVTRLLSERGGETLPRVGEGRVVTPH